jgi:uncharacterized protein YcfJ
MRTWFAAMVVAGGAFAGVSTFTKNIPVEQSLEVDRYITRNVPVRECWDEEVSPTGSGGSGAVGALLGGAAGGLLGHQVGGGSGKTAATIGGAVIGTLVGKSLAERGGSVRESEVVRRCRTRYENRRERVVEYKNIGYVMGRQIIKYSDRPLRSIPVKITVEY